MSEPKTLLQLAGADLEPAKLNSAGLILIDMQYEYLEGPIAVTDAAIAHAKSLLENAREAGSPVIHVAHKGRAGSLFDRDAKRGQIVDELAPMAGEITVEKSLPNAFAGTQLQAQISNSGRNDLILCAFMTPMCVSSTA